MEKLNSIISKNLVKHRQIAGLTQAALAEKLNYSDKAISKWERGDCLPDVSVLYKLTQIYGITLNDFLDETTANQKEVLPKKMNKHRHWFITIMSAGLTWLVAAIFYSILFLIPATHDVAGFAFLYAVPVCGIVLMVFSALWGNQYTNTLAATIILWGIILSICFSFSISRIWILCVIGGIFEILIIFWFMFRGVFKRFRRLQK